MPNPLLLAIAVAANPTFPADPHVDTIHFVHQGCKAVNGVCRMSYSLQVKEGEKFVVEIDNTKKSSFTYDISGFIAAPENKAQAASLDTTYLTQAHSKEYGGYLVSIRHVDAKGDPDFSDVELIIAVRTDTWKVSFGGGFPISRLTDPVYGLIDTTVGSTATHVIRRQRDHEDWLALGAASFVHAYNSSWPHWAMSFGLGVGSSGTSYFLGPSYRFGDAAAITFGGVAGPRKVLPTGLREGDVTDDANAMANLPTRVRANVFIAFSYSFAGGGAADFQKPFKTSDPASPSSPAPSNQSARGDVTATLSVPASTVGVKDAEVVFKLTLANPGKLPGGKFAKVSLTISPDAATKALFPDDAFTKVDVTPADDGLTATGSFSGKLKAELTKDASPSFKFDGGGISVTAATDKPIAKP